MILYILIFVYVVVGVCVCVLCHAICYIHALLFFSIVPPVSAMIAWQREWGT